MFKPKTYSRVVLGLILGLILMSSVKSYSQKDRYTEWEVKAAYIVNFTKFVTWPKEAFASENSPFIIGIYGNDKISQILQKMLVNKRINGRIPIIKIFTKPDEISRCNLLFISKVNKLEMQQVLKKVRGKNVLTVGDSLNEFCESGGMINFTHQYSKHRFEINNEAATREGIGISPKLLALAKIVTGDEITF